MYCLQVVIAHPSYKRPSAEVIIEHFRDEKTARIRLNEIKLQYIEDFNIDKASGEFATCQEDEDEFATCQEDEYVTIEEFDKLVESGKLYDIVYRDSYMDQNPFEYKITKIVFS